MWRDELQAFMMARDSATVGDLLAKLRYDSHPALRRHCGAAFSVLTDDNQEKVILVQEVERTHRRDAEIEEIVACIREAVANEHEIALDSIVLIRPGSIPKTTSGKIQRSAARRMWLQNSFETVDALSI